MSEARRDHTATLLTDGRVLIVGWGTTIAELYDPVTGTFSPIGNTLRSHGQNPTATRLLDGRVLIAGGTSALTFAEIYDPASGTFSATGNLNAPHFGHTTTLLKDGRVLVAGGSNASAITTAVTEVYDPATGMFSLTGALSRDRVGAASALLSDGRVLIAGGDFTTGPGFAATTDSAELYDPTAGTFSRTGNMRVPRYGFAWTQAPTLKSGEVLFAAGGDRSVELYDSATETFSFTGNMVAIHNIPSATLLLNGQVLIAGGYIPASRGDAVQTNVAELYDPLSATFTATASMASARQQHAATLLMNGQVLITGGFADGTELSSAELFTLLNPKISSAFKDHKNLIVTGERFDGGSVILLNGEAQKTKHDDQNPNTLIGKKVARKIDSGQTVILQVRNSNGTLSQEFSFTRP